MILRQNTWVLALVKLAILLLPVTRAIANEKTAAEEKAIRAGIDAYVGSGNVRRRLE